MKPILNANAITRALWAAPQRARTAFTSVAGAFSARGESADSKVGFGNQAARFAARTVVTVAKTTTAAGRLAILGATSRFKLGATAATGREAYAATVSTLKRITSQAAPRFGVRGSTTGLVAPAGNNAPVWGSAANATFNLARGASLDLRGSPYFTDADSNPMTMALVSGALPSGVTFSNGVFTASGSATVGNAGPFVVSADDGVNETVTTFTLTSTSTQTAAPFMLGHGFKKGDIPSGQGIYLSEPNAHVVVKRRWNDGSVKHAIIVGRTDLTANVAKTLTIYRNGSRGGTALTSANIQTANPSASVQCGAIGTVNLSSLLASPFRTWISTPEMVECHYRAAVGADANLNVWFHVRLWAGGRLWVRTVVENGYLNQTPGTKSYTATVTIGGTNVVNAQAITHYAFTRWTAEGWIGGNPAVTPAHNAAYLMSTKLVPNYWKRTPAASVLNGLTQTYAPMQLAPNSPMMADGGFNDSIAVLPRYSALYIASADARAFRGMLASSSAFNTYPIARRDPTKQIQARPTDWPSFMIDGGTFREGTPQGEWELNHLYNEGYAAYLASGDFWHYETLANNASMVYLCISISQGTGVNKVIRNPETRGVAWCLNAIGHFCAIAPSADATGNDAALISDYQTLFANNAAYWATQAGINGLGVLYEYNVGLYGPTGSVSQWQANFWLAVSAQLGRMEPIANMANWNTLRDWQYRWTVGQFGPTGSTNWHFSRGGSENAIIISPVNTSNLASMYQTWGAAWTATFGSANAETTNTLAGTPGASNDPRRAAVNNRWSAAITALSGAVEDGALGAAEAWTRLTGATNWNLVDTGDTSPANFNDTPQWGIVPRGFGGT